MSGKGERRRRGKTTAKTATRASTAGAPPALGAFFEQAFELSADGKSVVDQESLRTLLFNDAACGLLGYTRAEFPDLPATEFARPIEPDSLEAVIGRVLTDGQTEFEALARTKSGGTRRFHLWARNIAFDGRPAFYLVFRDVTAERQVQDALRHSHDLLERTGRLSHVGGWQLDLATQELRWTDEVYRIHELEPGSPISVPDAIAYYAPEARPVIAAAVQAAMDHGTPFDIEVPMITARGRHILVRAQGAAEARDGRPTFLHGAFQDVTALRDEETSRRLQSAALRAAADAIVITNRDGTVAWVNDAFTRLTGYRSEEAVGRNPSQLVKSGEHTAAFYRQLWDAILSGNTWQGEMINRRKDGSIYHEEQTITPIVDDTGAITHFVAIKRDLTQRVKLESQLRQSQKMETVGQLASGIAHDFNNLLTVIIGLGELMVPQLADDDPMRGDVAQIVESGRRAAALTRQLLAFSRRQMLTPTVLNLNEGLAGSEELLRRLLRDDIELVVEPGRDLGHIKADAGQIEQVIVNLAVNARDAMPNGGRLVIATQNVEVDADYRAHVGTSVPAGQYVQLSVTDNGTGMDAETCSRIFEPFFTTKAAGKGTGLGLAVVYGIVKQSQGFVWVYSEPGHGTSFRVYLPVVSGPADTRTVTPAHAPGANSETVLVIDDNPSLQKLVTRMLQSGGFHVLGAGSGEEALELLNRHKDEVRVIVTDVIMPQMSGRVLAEHAARLAPDIKVLYMSGYTDDVVLHHGLSEAHTAFINKPFNREGLLRKVRAVLDTP